MAEMKLPGAEHQLPEWKAADGVIKAWEAYCEGMGGTPDGNDYLHTLIQCAVKDAMRPGSIAIALWMGIAGTGAAILLLCDIFLPTNRDNQEE